MSKCIPLSSYSRALVPPIPTNPIPPQPPVGGSMCRSPPTHGWRGLSTAARRRGAARLASMSPTCTYMCPNWTGIGACAGAIYGARPVPLHRISNPRPTTVSLTMRCFRYCRNASRRAQSNTQPCSPSPLPLVSSPLTRCNGAAHCGAVALTIHARRSTSTPRSPPRVVQCITHVVPRRHACSKHARVLAEEQLVAAAPSPLALAFLVKNQTSRAGLRVRPLYPA